MLIQLAEKVKNWLLHMSRRQKRAILQFSDGSMFTLALIASFAVRFETIIIPNNMNEWIAFVSAPIIGAMCLSYIGIYRRITRNAGHSGTTRILIGISLAVLVWSVFVYLSGVGFITASGVPRSIIVLYWAFSFLFIWTSRQTASKFLSGSKAQKKAQENELGKALEKRILIWGYSETALQMIRSLRQDNYIYPVGIIDEDETLHFQKVDNVKIFPPSLLNSLIHKERVTDIFLDSEIVSRKRRYEIVRQLESYPVVFKVLPSVQDIVSGKIAIEGAKSIKVEDLLGRSPVPNQGDLLRTSVEGKVIMVTGAGGSIGSELVRQLARLGATKLILFELSEVALYHITAQLDEIIAEMTASSPGDEIPTIPEIVSIIGSVADEPAISHAIESNKVQTIYHAAAYKHVPIVEDNPVPGLENNSFGTWTIAKVARKHSVERFVLISTDKAVRPTNVMGASKRLAEMILQGMAAEKNGDTIFCMVRFGNVLDSSGSVVPKFRKQIEKGGPITVTHPDVIRYFMSIREAVGLVIQAGTLAHPGAVFVLDMGEPVKITDLARTMIQLAGQRVRDEAHPDGNIEIEITGLRPGEKLYEELLIGENTSPTRHPRISQLDEPFLPLNELSKEMARLKSLMKSRNPADIKMVLKEIIEEPVART